MNTEDLFDDENISGYIDDTPKKEPGIEDRLEKFQVGGRRKSKSRRHRSRKLKSRRRRRCITRRRK